MLFRSNMDEGGSGESIEYSREKTLAQGLGESLTD